MNRRIHRVVIDTNVLIRYLMRPSAAIRELIEVQWIGGVVQMVTAPELVAALKDVVSRAKLQRFIAIEDGQVLVDTVQHLAQMLPRLGDVPAYTREPKDDKFVACALLGQVDYLISVDEDLLVLQRMGTIGIVTPQTFLALRM